MQIVREMYTKLVNGTSDHTKLVNGTSDHTKLVNGTSDHTYYVLFQMVVYMLQRTIRTCKEW